MTTAQKVGGNRDRETPKDDDGVRCSEAPGVRGVGHDGQDGRGKPIALVIVLVVLLGGGLVFLVVRLVSGSPAPALTPPLVPARGRAYLGAWVNPEQSANGATASVAQAVSLEHRLGWHFSILHDYVGFHASPPAVVKEVNAISRTGAVPLIDWAGNGASSYLDAIVSGEENATIRALATALKNNKKPVFLRWFWEMNLQLSPSAGPLYIEAWDKIRSLFHAVGATNVAMVWCPGIAAHRTVADLAAFYPGAAEVDWIAVDGYEGSKGGVSGFSGLFGSWYQVWRLQGKPIMIAETGARSYGLAVRGACMRRLLGSARDEQAQYLRGLGSDLKDSYPDIRAVVYFDAKGFDGPWCLDKGGLEELRKLGDEPLFSWADRFPSPT